MITEDTTTEKMPTPTAQQELLGKLRTNYDRLYLLIIDEAKLLNALKEVGCSLRLDSTDVCVSMAGKVDGLQKVWGVFRRHGWETNNRPKVNDPTFATFWNKGDHRLFFMFTSTICRRIKVGMTTVEQPIYQIECGEITELGELL